MQRSTTLKMKKIPKTSDCRAHKYYIAPVNIHIDDDNHETLTCYYRSMVIRACSRFSREINRHFPLGKTDYVILHEDFGGDFSFSPHSTGGR